MSSNTSQQKQQSVKYILVSGGVLSGVGKGVIASSVGRVMKDLGFRTTAIKIDPYINIDAGTMSPFEHGEVFVLDDGGEADLDLGNYERFMDVKLTRDNNITTGKIYDKVIKKEREGKYLGKTVQVVPHICNAIQDWIEEVADKQFPVGMPNKPEICVIELGGTVGDIESMPFVEAMRQFQFRVGRDNFCLMHVSLVPVLGVVGEQKTKPTQQSVRELRALGLSPDLILCRSANPLTEHTKNKISLFCHVPPENVIGVHDVKNTYNVPLLLASMNVHGIVMDKLKLALPELSGDGVSSGSADDRLESWKALSQKFDHLQDMEDEVHIAIVGKYTDLTDAYLSIIKALDHASTVIDHRVVIDWIEASELENDFAEADPTRHADHWNKVRSAHGILVPGGFGDRGIEGKLAVANYARTHNIPYFGICLGFQIAAIEIARNVLGMKEATSEEFFRVRYGESPDVLEANAHNFVVVYMPEISKTHLGGTMRLGARETIIKDQNSTVATLYGNPESILERHRHRYEINPKMVAQLESTGMKFVGQDPLGQRMIISELKDHPYFVGTQFHPEFTSRPTRPSPPFVGLVKAALQCKHKTLAQ